MTKVNVAKYTASFNSKVDLARARLGVAAHERVLRLTNSDIVRNPVVRGVPFQQNPRFLGRDDVLSTLHQNLKSYGNEGSRQRSCVVHGIGGMGKTQIALEYTYRFRYEYSHILWCRAESRPELITSFGSFCQELTPASASNNQSRNVEVVLEWLMKSESRVTRELFNATIAN